MDIMRRSSGHWINHRDDRKPGLSARRGTGDAIVYEDDASIDDAEDGALRRVRRPGATGTLTGLNDNRPGGAIEPSGSSAPPAAFRGDSIPAG